MRETKNEIIKESFNEDFRDQLEYHLTRTFKNSADKSMRGFWCSGILPPFIDSQLTKNNLHKTRRIVTKAWLGFDGQGEFEMTINFGPNALEQYAKGSDLIKCLPDAHSMEWIRLDIDRKTIELHLS